MKCHEILDKDLQRIIDAPGWRAVQASFYHLLYVELLGTLDRDRVAKMTLEKHEEKPHGEAAPPSRSERPACYMVSYLL